MQESNLEDGGEFEDETCEIRGPIKTQESSNYKCWNCEEIGHTYKQCVKPRRIFCYGCGLVGFFLTDCPSCRKQENRQRGGCNNTSRHPKTQQ